MLIGQAQSDMRGQAQPPHFHRNMGGFVRGLRIKTQAYRAALYLWCLQDLTWEFMCLEGLGSGNIFGPGSNLVGCLGGKFQIASAFRIPVDPQQLPLQLMCPCDCKNF